MNRSLFMLRLGLLPGHLSAGPPIRLYTRYLHDHIGPRHAAPTPETPSLPQTVDLLQTYQGLVALGRIKPDEEQIRVVMQVSIVLHGPPCGIFLRVM